MFVNFLPYITSLISIFSIYLICFLLAKFIPAKLKSNSIINAIYKFAKNYADNFFFNAILRSFMQMAFEIFLWILLALHQNYQEN